jgi:glycosyltransferase involved in cell wall biosynthesis
MMDVAVFHPGTQHSWQTATALQDLDRLAFYATSIFHTPDRFPYRAIRWLPGPLRQRAAAELRRFEHPALDPALVRTVGVYEWLERAAARAGMPALAARLDRRGNRRFHRLLAGEIASPRPFALWGFSGASLEAFRAARPMGRFTILDRTIGDWRRYNKLMAPLFESHREWFSGGNPAMPDHVIRRDDEEYEAADVIVCGSQYCADTLRAHSPVAGLEGKIRVLPYCYDQALFADMAAPAPLERTAPVRFLFVGQLSMRKGIHHVLEAIARLPRSEAELTLVGSMMIPRQIFARFQDRVTYVPTVPRADIPGIMARHDVLVFPSYFEGSALCLIEGLASGLALIQTPQAGNGVTRDTGIMLERPDTDLTLAAMRAVIADRDRLDHYRASAPAEALNYTFPRYRENIAALLDRELSQVAGPTGLR